MKLEELLKFDYPNKKIDTAILKQMYKEMDCALSSVLAKYDEYYRRHAFKTLLEDFEVNLEVKRRGR